MAEGTTAPLNRSTARMDRRAEAGAAERQEEEQERPELTDEQLDAWILARLDQVGVDLSVLPDDDSDAPADRSRILASARRFLRSTPRAILDFPLDGQEVPPVMYPAAAAGRGGLGELPSAG